MGQTFINYLNDTRAIGMKMGLKYVDLHILALF